MITLTCASGHTIRLYTIAEAAAMLGRAERTVRQNAERNGLGHVVHRERLLTDADVEFMRNRAWGRRAGQRA
jgi:hypothetical protein